MTETRHERFTYGKPPLIVKTSAIDTPWTRHVDLKRAYSVLLGNIHKTLYNILTRKLAEEADPMVKSVLEKMARSDVMNDESLLTRTEREILHEFEGRREKLGVLERRVEEVVFILRDLAVVVGTDVG